MQGSNAGLCLCCGAPWPPVTGDVLDGDTLGNQAINKINKVYIRNEHMCKKFTSPKFGSPQHASHLLHQGHHMWAVQFMATKRTDALGLGRTAPNNDDEPLFEKPIKTRSKQKLIPEHTTNLIKSLLEISNRFTI